MSFLDEASPREGWKVALDGNAAWLRFDAVDLGRKGSVHRSQRRARPFRRGEWLYAGLTRYGFRALAVPQWWKREVG